VQPFGTGTYQYSDRETINMIYDLEPYAYYSQAYDKLNIITQQPNKGEIVESQIINTIMPKGLSGEIFHRPGD
jgi:hypothetical protein